MAKMRKYADLQSSKSEFKSLVVNDGEESNKDKIVNVESDKKETAQQEWLALRRLAAIEQEYLADGGISKPTNW